MDSPIFYVFLTVHIICLVIGFGAVMVIDSFGLLAVMGKVKLSRVFKIANATQKLIWLGWAGLVISGTGLIILKGYIDNLTLIKLFFVAMLGVNGIFLHFIKKCLREAQTYRVLPPLYKFRIALASVVSQVGWWGAIIIGLLHRYWRHYIGWPSRPLSVMVVIAVIFLAAFLVGEIVFKKK